MRTVLRTAVVGLALLTTAAMQADNYGRVRSWDDSARYLAPSRSKCLLSGSGRKFVDRLLTTLHGSVAERAVLDRGRIEIDSCFGINSDGSSFYSYDYDRMRAALVRALLLTIRDSFPTQPPTGLANSRWYADDRLTSDPVDKAAVAANEIGFCVARQNWQGVRAIVFAVDPEAEKRQQRPKSADDRELRIVSDELEKLTPSLAHCLPSGKRLAVNRFELRSLLEETALHAVRGGAVAE